MKKMMKMKISHTRIEKILNNLLNKCKKLNNILKLLIQNLNMHINPKV